MPRCKRCNRYFQEYEGSNGYCKPCTKLGFDKEKFNKKMDEVLFVLSTQGKLNLYIDQIRDIKNNDRLKFKYLSYNVTEMLMQLEFNRLGWKLKYQKHNLKYNYRYDFYLEPFDLDIEIDEKYHTHPGQRTKDEIRDKNIGVRHVLRIPEQVVRADIQEAAKLILFKIANEVYCFDNMDERLKKCNIKQPLRKYERNYVRKELGKQWTKQLWNRL